MTATRHGPTRLALRFSVAVRVDASERIGSGHVMRCLTLGLALRSAGHDVEFLSRESSGDLRSFLRDRHGFRVTTLPSTSDAYREAERELADAHATIEELRERDVDWIVVDHYDLGSTWEATVRSEGYRVLAIDDFASRRHACDLLVDHNLVPTSAYSDDLDSVTGVLLGPAYALVRQEFAAADSVARIPPRPRTVLVSFGGSDLSGQTLRVLQALRGTRYDLERVLVLAGQRNPDIDRIESVAKEWPAVEVHGFVEHPEKVMQSADLAIGAGGVSALERATMGVPSIVLATAGNQELPAQALARHGAILYLGTADSVDDQAITDAVDVMGNTYLRTAMR